MGFDWHFQASVHFTLSSAVNESQGHQKILEKIFGNAGNRTWGCWVSSKNAICALQPPFYRELFFSDRARGEPDAVRVRHLPIPMPETVPCRQAHEDRPREEQAVPMHPVSESFFVSYFSVHKYEHLTIQKKRINRILTSFIEWRSDFLCCARCILSHN